MCGIAGHLGPAPLDEERVTAGLAALRHRGPDGHGVYRARLRQNALTLLHTRLSIIDLDARANQPFRRDALTLAWNGEIYNYLELRAELANCGHVFTTESDTEVLLEAWRQWGPGCVDRLEGMWAAAMIDEAAGTLFLTRDRFGEKPLYLWHRPDGLYFASEMKALAALAGSWPDADLGQVKRYLVNGYRSLGKQARTWFHGVSELRAATTLTVTATHQIRAAPYWQLAYKPQAMTALEAVEGVRERLCRAVETRMRADVPLAFCLSGGVDSGALASIAAHRFGRKVHAFSILDHDPRYDESDTLLVTARALDCDHHIVETSRSGFLDRLEKLVVAHDAPVATISYYVHDFLSEAIATAGYKVSISGTGADELFTGYYDHYNFWLAEMRGRPDFDHLLEDWRRGYGSNVRNPYLKDPLVFGNNPAERGHLYLERSSFEGYMREPLDESFAERELSDNLLRNRMLNELADEAVPVILREDDLNCMRWSIENRSPFLDRNLAEFAFSVPNEHLVRNGCLKWLLREAVAGLLPDEVRLDRRKRGFNASIESLLDRRDERVRERLLAPGPIFEIVRRSAIEKLLDGDVSANAWSKFLFSFVSARLFLDATRSMNVGASSYAA